MFLWYHVLAVMDTLSLVLVWSVFHLFLRHLSASTFNSNAMCNLMPWDVIKFLFYTFVSLHTSHTAIWFFFCTTVRHMQTYFHNAKDIYIPINVWFPNASIKNLWNASIKKQNKNYKRITQHLNDITSISIVWKKLKDTYYELSELRSYNKREMPNFTYTILSLNPSEEKGQFASYITNKSKSNFSHFSRADKLGVHRLFPDRHQSTSSLLSLCLLAP